MTDGFGKYMLGCLAFYGLPAIGVLLYTFGIFDMIGDFFYEDFAQLRFWSLSLLIISVLSIVIWKVKKRSEEKIKDAEWICKWKIESADKANKKALEKAESQHRITVGICEKSYEYKLDAQSRLHKVEMKSLAKDYQDRGIEKQKEFEKTENELKEKITLLSNQLFKYKIMLKITSPFKEVAEMYATAQTEIYRESAKFLRNKPRPAIEEAKRIDELKKETKKWIASYKEMQYKYEYLLSVVPKLAENFESQEEIEEDINEAVKYSVSGVGDEDSDWLSKEEFEKLNEDEAAQLALDRWVKHHHHSKKAVGNDYEMYIAYLYKKDGWQVDYYGIENGLSDLGRDLIAYKIINNVRTFHVIQCKYWREKLTVHENVVCQTFGTAYEFFLKESKKLFPYKIDVIPYVITTTELSETALAFAQKLNVSYKRIPMRDYPRIKCNKNKTTGEKIYHLPFDQQYYNTLIKEDGECYALTTAEAKRMGFRRAHRHRI